MIQPLLKAADIGLLRYGGGSYGDCYGWQTNSNIQNCLPDDATASFVVTSTQHTGLITPPGQELSEAAGPAGGVQRHARRPAAVTVLMRSW